jgi:hypothetical protein
MMRFALLVFCGVAAALAFTGCSSGPKIKVQTRASFPLDGEKKATLVHTRYAEEIKLELPAIEAPGYHWQLVAHDTRFLRQLSEISRPVPPQRASAVSFLAIRSVPRTVLRFLLVRDDERTEATPVDRQDVTVEIE